TTWILAADLPPTHATGLATNYPTAPRSRPLDDPPEIAAHNDAAIAATPICLGRPGSSSKVASVRRTRPHDDPATAPAFPSYWPSPRGQPLPGCHRACSRKYPGTSSRPRTTPQTATHQDCAARNPVR